MDHAAAQVTGGEGQHAGSRNTATRLLGYVFALACLIWVFHDIHLTQLLAAIRITAWWMLGFSVLVDVLTYVLQGLRWKLLLSPVGRLRTLDATQAIYVALFTNEVVPLRFGELVRAYLVSRRLDSRIGAVIPSMVVERFLDALWLAGGIGIAAVVVPLPKDLLEAGDILGALVLVATAIFVWIVIRRERQLENGQDPQAVPQPEFAGRLGRSGEAISRFISELAGGLREIGLSRELYGAALLSAVMLMCQALAVWFIMLACGIKLPLLAGFVVVLVVRLGTAIPNAPANVGSFQFFTVVGLTLFGVDKTLAAGFSILDFAVLTAPLWIIGLFSLFRTGMSLKNIRAEISRVRSRASAA